MTTQASTLTEFLLARITEDEVAIEATIEADPAPSGWLGPMLTMLAAHRSLVNEARNYSPELEHGDNGEWAFDHTLRILAGTYASHPDYRAEWDA